MRNSRITDQIQPSKARAKHVVPVLLAVVAACAPAQPAAEPASPAAAQVAPSTDVYVYRLSRLLPFGDRLSNITNRLGYDNQPTWFGQTIYYTSQRGGQTDIYIYRDGVSTAFTRTPESEYSAALSPDGLSMTVVRVERDSTQRLWRFPLDGSAPSVVLPGIKPVGYFAWLDTATAALFVLGQPNTLQLANAIDGSSRRVASDIGRSLQRIPGGRRASFVQRQGTRWALRSVDPAPRSGGAFAVTTIGLLPDSAEYVVWRSETEAYTAGGSRIYRMRLPQRSWTQVVDLADRGIRNITRLALSSDGNSIAFVADDAARAP